MRISLDEKSSVPIYVQLVRQIKWEIVTGHLGEGEPVSSVRQLALDLRVNPNTIVKAYNELEHEGILVSRHGKGTFVAAGARRRVDSGREQVQALLEQAVRMGREAGLTADDIGALLREILQG